MRIYAKVSDKQIRGIALNQIQRENNFMDRHALGVVVVYVIQMEGLPSIKEVWEVVQEKLKCEDVKRCEVKNAILSAKKRGLLSVNYDDTRLERYSVKDVRWANPPEIAHIKTLLPKLLETPEAKMISEILKGIEKNDTENTKERQAVIRDYVTYKIHYVALHPILGGQPSDEEDEVLKLRRSNGSIWLPMNIWMRAAVSIPFRMMGIAESKSQYFRFGNVYLPWKEFEGKMIEAHCPVGGYPGKPGTGITKLQGLPAGTEFDVIVSFPTEGIGKDIGEADVLKCLSVLNIGAKHKDYGLIQSTKSEKIGIGYYPVI